MCFSFVRITFVYSFHNQYVVVIEVYYVVFSSYIDNSTSCFDASVSTVASCYCLNSRHVSRSVSFIVFPYNPHSEEMLGILILLIGRRVLNDDNDDDKHVPSAKFCKRRGQYFHV
jgi:hypothetical protein